MAPEVFGQASAYSAKSDIYSLGLTLWELASRRIPFQDADDHTLIPRWVEQGEREDIPEDCPAKLSSIIKTCWSGNPSDRPDAEVVGEYMISNDGDFAVFLSKRRSGGEGEKQFSAVVGSGRLALALPSPTSSVRKPLEQLSDMELERWLTTVKLGAVIPKFREHSISGEVLAQCETIEEIAEFVPLRAQAKLLLSKIQKVKCSGGVELSLLYHPVASASTLPAVHPAELSVSTPPSEQVLIF
eukprot:gene1806-biopygen1949